MTYPRFAVAGCVICAPVFFFAGLFSFSLAAVALAGAVSSLLMGGEPVPLLFPVLTVAGFGGLAAWCYSCMRYVIRQLSAAEQ